MAAPSRMYIVSYGDETKLVDARTVAEARSFVSSSMISVKVATTHDVARLISEGIKVETAVAAAKAPAKTSEKAAAQAA